MVEVALVKKRKRKIIAAIVGGISAIGMTVFIIIAFIGQYVGSFTVQIDTQANISIYEDSSFQNPTTYIRVGDLPAFQLYSGTFLKRLMDKGTELDDDKIKWNDPICGKVTDDPKDKNAYLKFLKYTFYLRNDGKRDVNYNLAVKVTETVAPTKKDGSSFGYDYLDLARIRLYSNRDSAHTYLTYAKSLVDDKGNKYAKAVAKKDPKDPEYCGLAEQFTSDTLLFTDPSSGDSSLGVNEWVRYTFVYWLEGEDDFAQGEQPENGSIKFGIEISAI